MSAAYTSIARLRAEGVTVAMASDDRLTEVIAEASDEIDRITRWWFEPRELTLALNGNGQRILALPAPPLAIESVEIGEVAATDWDAQGWAPTSTPKRPAPAMVRRGCGWPSGTGNVVVVGTFGYTEADGTENGRTPRAIRRAAELMSIRMARPLMAEADERFRGRVQSMRTSKQSMSFFGNSAGSTAFDEDPEISRLLAGFINFGMGFV